MMIIANPIYDTAFKYLMENNKIAKKIISTIIGEQVVDLVFSPQEYTYIVEGQAKKPLTHCRFDFSAKIKTPDEEERVVMIEMQKANRADDIMRFRRYLGLQYQSTGNSYIVNTEKKETKEKKEIRKATQIYCIFILGDGLGVEGVPVLKINHIAKDNTTGVELKNQEIEFIESLHHRSWIIQVPELKERRRNDLEIMLSIFDQSYCTSEKGILSINEEDFPKKFRPIVRHLSQAVATKEIRNAMQCEDEVLEEYRQYERMEQEFRIALDEERAAAKEKDKTILEKDKALERERAAAKEKDIALEQERAAFERERAAAKEKDIALEQERAAFERERAAAKEKDIALEQERAAISEKDNEIAELKRLLNKK
jgi:hypothetical protein